MIKDNQKRPGTYAAVKKKAQKARIVRQTAVSTRVRESIANAIAYFGSNGLECLASYGAKRQLALHIRSGSAGFFPEHRLFS